MLINALINIGKSLEKQVERTDFDPDIIKYINLKYPNPPKMDYIIKITIKPCILEEFAKLKKKIENINKDNLSEFVNIKLNKSKKQELVSQIFGEIEPDFEDFNKCIETNIFEYEDEHAYKMLRGDQSGASVFLSPTMFAKISARKIVEFPLWKIKLDSNILRNLKRDENETDDFIIEFFNQLPNMKENSKLIDSDTDFIFKFIISDIIKNVLNKSIENYSLKTGFYYFPICFNGQWPYENELIKEYYRIKISDSGSAEKGICEGCGQIKEISEGLSKELGFFSVDQLSFVYSFFQHKKYRLCNECKYFAEKGFNYVKKNLRLYLGNRGTNKNPFEMYVIPITEKIEDLKKVLSKINFNRINAEKDKNLEKIKRTGDVALEAKESRIEEESIQEKKDLNILLLNLSSMGKKESKLRFELLLITFYHPEGQSSNFHNIISIDIMDYEKIINIAKALAELNNSGEWIYLSDIFYIFGQHKFRTYISKLLNLKSIKLADLCKDAFLNQKKDFFKFMADPSNPPNYIRTNMFRLNTYIKLTSKLGLI
ncbi:MAG: hypothetical protein ACTSRP_22500 [Candidatus Helarchaeota archaeon]